MAEKENSTQSTQHGEPPLTISAMRELLAEQSRQNRFPWGRFLTCLVATVGIILGVSFHLDDTQTKVIGQQESLERSDIQQVEKTEHEDFGKVYGQLASLTAQAKVNANANSDTRSDLGYLREDIKEVLDRLPAHQSNH